MDSWADEICAASTAFSSRCDEPQTSSSTVDSTKRIVQLEQISQVHTIGSGGSCTCKDKVLYAYLDGCRQLVLQVLFRDKRLKQEPYEWVYDGLQPLMVSDVLRTGKGMALSLALIYAFVARRLGLALGLIRVPTVGGHEVYLQQPLSSASRTSWSQTLSSAQRASVNILVPSI